MNSKRREFFMKVINDTAMNEFFRELEEKIKDLIAGLVKRQFLYICLDPYANAFNEGPTGACWEKDDPDQSPWVWERKFEIDSLCYPVQLAWLLWKNTGCTAQFDENFREGVWKILDVFQTEQNTPSLLS